MAFGRCGRIGRRRGLAVDRRRLALCPSGSGGRLGRSSRGLATSPASSNDLARIACTSTPPTPPLPRLPAPPAAMPASSNDLARIAGTSTPGPAPAFGPVGLSVRTSLLRAPIPMRVRALFETLLFGAGATGPINQDDRLASLRGGVGGRGLLRRGLGFSMAWLHLTRRLPVSPPAFDPLLGQSPEPGNRYVDEMPTSLINGPGLPQPSSPPVAIGAPCAMPVMRYDSISSWPSAPRQARRGSRRPSLRRRPRRISRARRSTLLHNLVGVDRLHGRWRRRAKPRSSAKAPMKRGAAHQIAPFPRSPRLRP